MKKWQEPVITDPIKTRIKFRIQAVMHRQLNLKLVNIVCENIY